VRGRFIVRVRGVRGSGFRVRGFSLFFDAGTRRTDL
jgi:hypothetical protein